MADAEPERDPLEPPRGSVVMRHGTSGTAYQRFYRDGLWHGTNGDVARWADIRAEDEAAGRTVLVVHVPPSTPL